MSIQKSQSVSIPMMAVQLAYRVAAMGDEQGNVRPDADIALMKKYIAEAKQILGLNSPKVVEVVRESFGYYINLDERGQFFADVRTREGKTIHEIHIDSGYGEDDTNIFDDGYMENKTDVEGLRDYLVQLSVIPAGSEILPMAEFEETA